MVHGLGNIQWALRGVRADIAVTCNGMEHGTTMATTETMTEYIRQLLVLDESSRRETLQSLSEYNDTKQYSNGTTNEGLFGPWPGVAEPQKVKPSALSTPAFQQAPAFAAFDSEYTMAPGLQMPKRVGMVQQGVALGADDKSANGLKDLKSFPEADGLEGDEFSLRSYLNYLKQIDAGRILLVRKINRLGFDSSAVLTAHYSAYGQLEHVFVPRSRSVARSQSSRPFVRKRPSGIGFVVMGDSEAVDAILQDGEVQCVAGVSVHLQRFRRQSFSDMGEEEM